MRRGVRNKISPFAAGLIAIVVIAVGCYFGFTKANPFANNFELVAAFDTANDLKKGSQVRIGGVKVGTVTDVEAADPESEVGREGGAIVRMEIEDRGLPIHEDVTMKIRPRIFLEGNWFVDVHPGSPSAPEIEEGETVPVTQTTGPVQFGQLLDALQSDTRQDLQIVLDEYGKAVHKGGAKAFNRSIKWWKRAFRDSAIVNDAMLGTEEGDLGNYIAGAQKFAAGLDRDPRALKSLLTDFADTADAFASEETNLTRAIRELPKTLIVGQSALGELNAAFPNLRRFVAEMRPAVRSSGPALDATLPLLQQLRRLVGKDELGGLIQDLEPVVANLTELNEGGVPLQKELRELSNCGNEVLIPWRNSKVGDPVFEPSGPVFQEQVKWLPGIAAESRNFDANGQFVRSLANGFSYAYAAGGDNFMFSGQAIQGVNPPRQDKGPPLRVDEPCENQAVPDLRSTPDAPPEQIKVNHNAPGAAEARAKGYAKGIRWVREEIERLGTTVGGKPLKVSPEFLKPSEVAKLPGGGSGR